MVPPGGEQGKLFCVLWIRQCASCKASDVTLFLQYIYSCSSATSLACKAQPWHITCPKAKHSFTWKDAWHQKTQMQMRSSSSSRPRVYLWNCTSLSLQDVSLATIFWCSLTAISRRVPPSKATSCSFHHSGSSATQVTRAGRCNKLVVLVCIMPPV